MLANLLPAAAAKRDSIFSGGVHTGPADSLFSAIVHTQRLFVRVEVLLNIFGSTRSKIIVTLVPFIYSG
jgi:hypothetical protein